MSGLLDRYVMLGGLGGALVLVMALAATALSSGGGGNADAQSATPVDPGPAHFGILRAPASAQDAPEHVVLPPGATMAGLRHARLAVTAAAQMWATTADAGGTPQVCVLAARKTDYGPAATCGASDRAAVDGLFATESAGASGSVRLKPHETQVFGLVPDGVKSVTISYKGGTTTVSPVDNVIFADVPSATQSASFVAADGSTHSSDLPSYDA